MTAHIDGMTTSVISIQSQVVHGHVGNSAAVLPMQVHGLNVAAIPTTLLSNNPHFETMRGRVLESELVGDLLRGVEERGLIQTSRYIISGYLGSRANGDVVADFVERARQINPDIIYICDPVMGDVNLGVFVANQVVECLLERLVPMADILTPNQFELSLIAEGAPTCWTAFQAAAARAQSFRGAQLVVTGCIFSDTPAGSLENVVCEHHSRTRLLSQRLPTAPVGTGDLFTGLLAAKLAEGDTLEKAARGAAATILTILSRTIAAGEQDMQLASVIDVLTPNNPEKLQ